MALTIIFLFASLWTIHAKAEAPVQPVISAQWLLDNQKAGNLRIIDLQSPEGYQRAHIPGSVNSSYGQWRQANKAGLKKMLPAQDYLEGLVGALGIKKETHVILAPIGISASEVAVATRVFWTLKVMGHEKVSILNGGLLAYSQLPEAKFDNKPTMVAPTLYKATWNADMAPNAEAVNFAWKQGIVFVDSRSEEEYTGKVAAPGERPGTIPDARFMPFDGLLEQKGRAFFFPTAEKLQAIYAEHKVPTKGRQISFCHTGHRTSVSWFASHELLGNKDAKMYDGSIAEWGIRKDLPMDIPK